MKKYVDRKLGSKITIVDPSVVGQSHILVNVGFIGLLAEFFSEIVIIASYSHIRVLEQYLKNEPVVAKYELFSFSTKAEMFRLISTSHSTSHSQSVCDRLLFLNCEYDIFMYINFAYRKNSSKILWVMHSHFLTFRHRSPSCIFKNAVKKFTLFYLFKNIQLVVCGTRIAQNLQKHTSVDLSRFVFPVFHPIGVSMIGDQKSAPENSRVDGKINILFYKGWQAIRNEHGHTISELANECARKKYLHFDIRQNPTRGFDNIRSLETDYRVRIDRISKMDLCLQLPVNDYSLQASGAIMDLLLAATPAIGIRTDFSQELQDIIGPYGFFFEDGRELIQFIQSTPEHVWKSNIEIFRKNLADGSSKVREFSRNNLKQVLFQQK